GLPVRVSRRALGRADRRPARAGAAFGDRGPGPGGAGAGAVDGRRPPAEQYKRLGQMQLRSPRRAPAGARRLFWRAWRISPAGPLAAWVVLSVLPPMLVRAIDGAVSRVWSRRSG